MRALTSTRRGGCSVGSYASLNLALHVGDEPDAVTENRSRFIAAGGLPGEPVWLEQVHGANVLRLDAAAGHTGAALQFDAAWTSDADVVCCVMTADCLPILLCDSAGSKVGIAHAGWRGLAGGVIEASVAAMGRGDLLAWLGPAISQSAYEVGPDVCEAFVSQDPGAAAAFAPNPRGRWQADLYALARNALARAGVTRVYGGEFCTHSDGGRFFSHRREAPCGRMATVIWLDRAG